MCLFHSFHVVFSFGVDQQPNGWFSSFFAKHQPNGPGCVFLLWTTPTPSARYFQREEATGCTLVGLAFPSQVNQKSFSPNAQSTRTLPLTMDNPKVWFGFYLEETTPVMMCIVIIAQYADCTPCGFGSRQKVRSVVHPRAAILHFDGSG